MGEVGIIALGVIIVVVVLIVSVTVSICLEKHRDTALEIERLKARSANIVAQGWPPEHCDADGEPD